MTCIASEDALGTYFSKRKVRELEPRPRTKVLPLRQRLLERAGGGSVNIRDAFGALTLGMLVVLLWHALCVE